MKKLNVLRAFVKYMWISWGIALFILTCVYIYTLFTGKDIFNLRLNGDEIAKGKTTIEFQILNAVIIFSAALFIYGIYLFDEVLGYFKKREPFDDYVIKSFTKIGRLIIIGSLSSSLSLILYSVHFPNHLKPNISFTIVPFIPIVCLGLFFMILSEIFKIAKAAKEENELTV
ncbi:DUF2975 domain-containing protein [Mangrovimonas aestuarii]|uniref:DUF2975 domain-containing protein n=1 Tax=Mangrovimonas aestuarii TaxID=3018443 RepID=UPI002378CA69|nr:DUF2975 domain-containing protein [Mangrovimonas aestuarii]